MAVEHEGWKRGSDGFYAQDRSGFEVDSRVEKDNLCDQLHDYIPHANVYWWPRYTRLHALAPLGDSPWRNLVHLLPKTVNLLLQALLTHSLLLFEFCPDRHDGREHRHAPSRMHADSWTQRTSGGVITGKGCCGCCIELEIVAQVVPDVIGSIAAAQSLSAAVLSPYMP